MLNRHRLLCAALGGGLALLLAGCAGAPDPEETRDALTEVVTDPAPPEAAKELDADAEPDPVVEPLDCSPYLAITARGTGEPTRGQLLSPVARTVSDARPGSVQVVDIGYPADADVKEGGTIGARLLIDTLNVQAETCPEQRSILLGYSQGALIVGDALVSPGLRLVGSTVGEISEEASERILAIVLYGNPRFNGGESYNAGSYDPALSGLLPRPLGGLGVYADRIRDYCVARDFVCQSSLDLDEQVHIAYYDNGMQEDGAAFVITRLDPPNGDPDEPQTDDEG